MTVVYVKDLPSGLTSGSAPLPDRYQRPSVASYTGNPADVTSDDEDNDGDDDDNAAEDGRPGLYARSTRRTRSLMVAGGTADVPEDDGLHRRKFLGVVGSGDDDDTSLGLNRNPDGSGRLALVKKDRKFTGGAFMASDQRVPYEDDNNDECTCPIGRPCTCGSDDPAPTREAPCQCPPGRCTCGRGLSGMLSAFRRKVGLAKDPVYKPSPDCFTAQPSATLRRRGLTDAEHEVLDNVDRSGFAVALEELHVSLTIKVTKVELERVQGLSVLNVHCHNPPDGQDLNSDAVDPRKWVPLHSTTAQFVSLTRVKVQTFTITINFVLDRAVLIARQG